MSAIFSTPQFRSLIFYLVVFQMGHRPGEGLGKSGQGIIIPVQAVVRKGKGAVGAYGSEKTEKPLKDFPVKDEEEEEEKEFQKQLSQWKRQPTEVDGFIILQVVTCVVC